MTVGLMVVLKVAKKAVLMVATTVGKMVLMWADSTVGMKAVTLVETKDDQWVGQLDELMAVTTAEMMVVVMVVTMAATMVDWKV